MEYLAITKTNFLIVDVFILSSFNTSLARNYLKPIKRI